MSWLVRGYVTGSSSMHTMCVTPRRSSVSPYIQRSIPGYDEIRELLAQRAVIASVR